jgi:hypothetical protein
MFATTEDFDGAAAVTRSLLGYGVLAGVVYLLYGTVLGLSRDGFEFSDHPLSLLMLGDDGWLQRLNLLVSGAMVATAALGVRRALAHEGSARRASLWLFGYAACLAASSVFAPDPANGFPPGSPDGEISLTGLLHLAFGAGGFVCIAAAALVIARWHDGHGRSRRATQSRAGAIVVLVGFLGGAALSSTTIGIALLWVAVLATWLWLAVTSIDIYRRVPHPVIAKRPTPA